MIAEDFDLLFSQLTFSAQHQGKVFDKTTGEEPGKIHHEYPGVVVNMPYLTTYNACDTTGLFLLGIEALLQLDHARGGKFIVGHLRHIEAAVNYIQAHTKNGIFWEYPPDNAKGYSLQVTYWKDSILPLPGQTEPKYPVTFALSHFQAAAGLLAAASLLKQGAWKRFANKMFRSGIEKFMTPTGFIVMEDAQQQLVQESSDELHCLRYIPSRYAHILPLRAIRERAELLITPAGIACTPRSVSTALDDTYHGYVVWPFEQALIHAGATRFGLTNLASVTTRCTPYILDGQELLTIEPDIEPSGNDRQLWSVAAEIYFKSIRTRTKTAKPLRLHHRLQYKLQTIFSTN